MPHPLIFLICLSAKPLNVLIFLRLFLDYAFIVFTWFFLGVSRGGRDFPDDMSAGTALPDRFTNSPEGELQPLHLASLILFLFVAFLVPSPLLFPMFPFLLLLLRHLFLLIFVITMCIVCPAPPDFVFYFFFVVFLFLFSFLFFLFFPLFWKIVISASAACFNNFDNQATTFVRLLQTR